MSAPAKLVAPPAAASTPALPARVLRLPADAAPNLLVVIDTEEEFDWYADFDRGQTAVSAMDSVGRAQDVFDEFGLLPTYVVDYPVASQEQGAAPLRQFLRDGRCSIGAHQHPWVCPPFDEELCGLHSYPGNLPAELERAKLRELVAVHEKAFGTRPRIYKAGRYGLGAASGSVLAEQGFEVDVSARPSFDLSSQDGPDYSRFPPFPFWLHDGREVGGAQPEGVAGREDAQGVLAIPESGGFVGFAAAGGPALHRLASRPALRRAKVPGILSRLGALDRLQLSPEGFSHTDHRRLTEALFARGVRTFIFSFHSPSVAPGFTPYAASEKDVQDLLDTCRRYFEYFLGTLGGVGRTPLELKELLMDQAEEQAS